MRRTGLTADVLRAWEKRYRAVSPHRSEGGQRLYSDDDVDRLGLLQRVTGLGRNIGQVARLRTDQLRMLLMQDESALEGPPVPDDDRTADRMRAEAMDRVEALDGPELEKLLRRGALQLGVGPLVEQTIVPLLREIEDRRLRGECTPAHEHLAGSVVQRVVHWMCEILTRTADAPRIILATTEEERHELGIQIVAAVAAALAWRVVYLGGELSADSIIQATRQAAPQVLALSYASADGVRNAREPLRMIREGVSPAVAVVAAGDGAEEMQRDLAALGISVMPGLGDLRAFLRSFQ
jgi:DNA-binding transcriptional MerR regulator/methylmalonyl-CoA mutase cobalamin-binding subunit